MFIVMQAEVLKSPLIHTPKVGEGHVCIRDWLAGVEGDFRCRIGRAVRFDEKLSQLLYYALGGLTRTWPTFDGVIGHRYGQRIGFTIRSLDAPLLAQIEEQSHQMSGFRSEDAGDPALDVPLADTLRKPVLEGVGERGPAIACRQPLLQGALRFIRKRRIKKPRRTLAKLDSRDGPLLCMPQLQHHRASIRLVIRKMQPPGVLGMGQLRIPTFMLRVRETATAELLTRQLPKVEVYTTTLVSGATDSSDIHGPTDFTSNAQDRISTSSVPLIEPAHVVGLPKGQCFALIEGGNLWKVRMPLPAPDPDEAMPRDLQQLAGYMRQRYAEAGEWWEGNGLPRLLDDDALPADLAEEVQEGTPDEEAPS